MISGDFEVVAGVSRYGGVLCPEITPPGGGGCDCDGKVTELTLEYLGTAAAFVEILQKKDGESVFAEAVQPNQPFTFVGKDKKGTLGTEISIYVDGALNTKIHTSCSQPIGPGQISGDFKVIEGYSRGGQLCPYDQPPEEPGDDECDCDGKVTELTLQYNGTVENAHIVVEQKAKKKQVAGVVLEGTFSPGSEFTFSGSDKKGTLGTEISIYVDGVLNTKIHTSCSRPIGPGLISGDFEVIEGYSRNGGLLCPLEPL